jgi:hypothetical protein
MVVQNFCSDAHVGTRTLYHDSGNKKKEKEFPYISIQRYQKNYIYIYIKALNSQAIYISE